MENEDLDLYLQYAGMLDSRDCIMSLNCRMYYIEKKIEHIRQQGKESVDKTTAEVFKKVENTNLQLGLTKAQKAAHVNAYCKDMYNKIIKTVLAGNNDKALCVRKLETMVNFLLILTIFGPLTLEWDARCKVFVQNIDNECLKLIDQFNKELKGKDSTEEGKQKDQARDSKEQNEPKRFRIEFEEIADSVYVKRTPAKKHRAEFTKTVPAQPEEIAEDFAVEDESKAAPMPK